MGRHPRDPGPPAAAGSELPAGGGLGAVGAEGPGADGVAQVPAEGGMGLFDAADGVADAPLDRLAGALDRIAGPPRAASQAVGGGQLGGDPFALGACPAGAFGVAEGLGLSQILPQGGRGRAAPMPAVWRSPHPMAGARVSVSFRCTASPVARAHG